MFELKKEIVAGLMMMCFIFLKISVYQTFKNSDYRGKKVKWS